MKTEKRKAKVGERILITNALMASGGYKNGDILTVEGSIETSGILGYVFAQGIDVSILDGEYEVIVDETEADNVGIIEKLQADLVQTKAELEALKERVRVLEQIEKKRVDDEVYNEYLNGNLDDIIENSIKEARKWEAQIKRDEIIEKAKREVEEIRNDPIQMEGLLATFIVDREKRMVTALLSSVLTGVVERQGVAKCHPDDCFNIHLGKIIALYKALGLEVPDEYLNAPQPTEVRVGDIVEYVNTRGEKELCEAVDRYVSPDEPYIHYKSTGAKKSKIIDDSRESVTE